MQRLQAADNNQRVVLPAANNNNNGDDVLLPRHPDDGNHHEIRSAIADNTAAAPSCILTLHGMILDLSQWDGHPGGREILQRYHGRDGTQAFEAAGHSDAAKSLLVSFLADDDNDDNNNLHSPPPPLAAVSQPTKIFLFLSLLAWFHHRPSIQLGNHHGNHAPSSAISPALPCARSNEYNKFCDYAPNNNNNKNNWAGTAPKGMVMESDEKETLAAASAAAWIPPQDEQWEN